jgi:transcription antitermination factor NusG
MTMESSGGPWFVAHTLSNREKLVSAHLGGREIEHYLPTYTRTRRCFDRKTVCQAPLFPGYLFVRFTRTQQLSVVTVPGLLRLLDASGGLASVSNEEVARLREGIRMDLEILPARPYNAGDRVRILAGPFRDYEATVSASKGRRVMVVMSVGPAEVCCFSLDMDAREVEPLGASLRGPGNGQRAAFAERRTAGN